MRALIIGCGDIGLRTARSWDEGPVTGVVRRPESAARLVEAGVEPRVMDLDQPGALPPLPTAGAAVVYLVPPPAQGEGDPRLLALLTHLARGPLPARIVYLSTSGVYGDRGGDWVDESAPVNPDTARARRRLAAEQAVTTFAAQHGVAHVILRVGGIYGPDRLPVERLRRGDPVLRVEECGYTNRIHADDLARVVAAAARRARPGAVYNVSDGCPGTMTEYLLAVADHLGLPHPPQISMAEAKERLSPAMLSYLTESRRLDSRRMREELGVKLQYPDLAAGLAACRT